MALIDVPRAVADARLAEPRWDPCENAEQRDRRVRAVIAVNALLAAWYFGWLLQPSRVGQPVLYGLLLVAEFFNLAQAIGFWWTCASAKPRAFRPATVRHRVDVFVPTFNESVDVVTPTLIAARELNGHDVRVYLLDDGNRPQMAALADRLGVEYIARTDHSGAKAGNINNALTLTDAPFIAIFDCDHVPRTNFLERTLGYFSDDRVAYVQTPQYYANADDGIAGAAWSQQALFFGPIARGKDGQGSMFCCGTNMVFRREALSGVGGFPTRSVTEDFELSIGLTEAGWTSVYVPEVLASGLAPEDMSSYVTQQFRWARGCLSSIPRVLFSRMPLRVRVQYLLSSMFFATGWSLAIYMSFPIVRLLTGAQPIRAATANVFLLHFAPYFLAAIGTVALAGGGAYTFPAFALVAATFWVHIGASLAALAGSKSRFKVTSKSRSGSREVRVVIPTLLTVTVLACAAGFGLVRDRSPGTLNNVGFAVLHLAVLLRGAWPAIGPPIEDDPGSDQFEPAA